METTTSTVKMPAHRDRNGFPLDFCKRCGGSGRFSYNSIHGDRCYGCGGTGWVPAAGVGKILTEWRTANRKRRRPIVGDMVVGDEVSDFAGVLTDKATGNWLTIEAIEVSDVVDGWSVKPDGERVPTSWRTVLRFTDGTSRNVSTNSVLCRKGGEPAAPFVERALKAWRKAGCKGGVK